MYDDYNRAFVRRAHQLLFWGYKEARQQFNSDTNEEVISQYISMCIKNLLKYGDIDEEYWRFEVVNEALVSDTGRTGNSRKEIDILLYTNDPRTRPELIFEAKRLKKGAFYVSDYVGAEGMQCFIQEQYAKHCPIAAMIGYMQSNDINHWQTQLDKEFRRANQKALQIVKSLTRCSNPIITDLPHEWISEHKRLSQPAITIYHIFLDCS